MDYYANSFCRLLSSLRLVILVATIPLAATVCDAQIHVDASAPTGGDGETWLTAYDNLHDGLDDAEGTPLEEVLVAQGTYKPHPLDPEISFDLRDGVKLLGGYRGAYPPPGGEGPANDRDVDQFVTILSGEIGSGLLTDNSFHVVRSTENTDDTLIDGFTITRGHALGPAASNDQGAGMLLFESDAHVARCTFVDNHAVIAAEVLLKRDCPWDCPLFRERPSRPKAST